MSSPIPTARLRLQGPGIEPALAAKRARLEEILGGMGRTLVAYSGGVDSAFLLDEAHRVVAAGVLGVIAKSPSLPGTELDAALKLAASRGIGVRVIETHEMERAGYRRNGSDRCFHCKSELFERLREIAGGEGFDSLAYGALTDDLGDVRPGMEAAERLRIRAPLLEALLGKLEVRILARHIGLGVWDKPQSACLASRIPHGTEVTRERLGQVEQSEDWLRETLALRVVRVRHEGTRARIEVLPSDISRVSEPAALGRIRSRFEDLGFLEVEVDPRGYRRPDPRPNFDQEEPADAYSR